MIKWRSKRGRRMERYRIHYKGKNGIVRDMMK
jgi:hypothetical protein